MPVTRKQQETIKIWVTVAVVQLRFKKLTKCAPELEVEQLAGFKDGFSGFGRLFGGP